MLKLISLCILSLAMVTKAGQVTGNVFTSTLTPGNVSYVDFGPTTTHTSSKWSSSFSTANNSISEADMKAALKNAGALDYSNVYNDSNLYDENFELRSMVENLKSALA